MGRLDGIPEARQRPALSHLERAFATWLAKQLPDASGSLVIMERQARIDVERLAGKEVPLRLMRWLAAQNGFRRTQARRARLWIKARICQPSPQSLAISLNCSMSASRPCSGHSRLGAQTPKADIEENIISSGKLGAVSSHYARLCDQARACQLGKETLESRAH